MLLRLNHVDVSVGYQSTIYGYTIDIPMLNQYNGIDVITNYLASEPLGRMHFVVRSSMVHSNSNIEEYTRM